MASVALHARVYGGAISLKNEKSLKAKSEGAGRDKSFAIFQLPHVPDAVGLILALLYVSSWRWLVQDRALLAKPGRYFHRAPLLLGLAYREYEIWKSHDSKLDYCKSHSAKPATKVSSA
jgi:hypothetical protein